MRAPTGAAPTGASSAQFPGWGPAPAPTSAAPDGPYTAPNPPVWPGIDNTAGDGYAQAWSPAHAPAADPYGGYAPTPGYAAFPTANPGYPPGPAPATPGAPGGPGPTFTADPAYGPAPYAPFPGAAPPASGAYAGYPAAPGAYGAYPPAYGAPGGALPAPHPTRASRAGLWWGLGIGGGALVLVMILVIVAVATTAASSGTQAEVPVPAGAASRRADFGSKCGSSFTLPLSQVAPAPPLSALREGPGELVGQPAPLIAGTECHTGDPNTTLLAAGGNAKPTLIVFWANWCPHCQREMPLIEELAKQHQNDWSVVTVSEFSRETPSSTPAAYATPSAFIRSTGLTMPTIVDPQFRFGMLYRVTGTPRMFFLNSAGIIRDVEGGELPPSEVEARMRNAAAQ